MEHLFQVLLSQWKETHGFQGDLYETLKLIVYLRRVQSRKFREKALKHFFPPNPSPVPAVGKHLAKHPLSSCSLQKFPELVQPTKTLISTKTHTTPHLSRQLK